MNIIISENQYKVLITENYHNKIKNIYSHYQSFMKKLISDIKKQYKLSTRFALTYGAGIGAIAEPVNNYLKDKYISLTSTQISALVIAAIFVVYYENKDYTELIKQLKKEGLSEELNDAISKTEKIKTKFVDMLNILGLTTYKSMDIISYTFMLPILSMLINVLTTFGFNSIEFLTLTEALFTSGLFTTSGIVIRDILRKIASVMGKKSEIKKK